MLEGLTGVHRHHDHLRGGPEQVAQSAHTLPDPLRGEDGEVVGPDEIKNQLTTGDLYAVFGELTNAHELAGGLPLAQGLLLLAGQGVSLHS